jgi:hypothetical protein
MNSKLLLCLALILSGILTGCSTLIHGVNLSASKEQIRASILKITPLGTPFEKAKTLIQTKLHPVTFVYYKHTRGLWGTGIPTGGGGEYHGKAIGCEIGIGGYLANEIVDGMWVFDDKERLVYLFIYKEPNLP